MVNASRQQKDWQQKDWQQKDWQQKDWQQFIFLATIFLATKDLQLYTYIHPAPFWGDTSRRGRNILSPGFTMVLHVIQGQL